MPLDAYQLGLLKSPQTLGRSSDPDFEQPRLLSCQGHRTASRQPGFKPKGERHSQCFTS